MPLITREINVILNWSSIYVITNSIDTGTFKTNSKRYVPVVTLSTQDNAKLLEQLKSGFKKTVIRNKYLLKLSTERQNSYLDCLIDPSFQGVNRLFVLLLQDNTVRNRHRRYFLPTVERL